MEVTLSGSFLLTALNKPELNSFTIVSMVKQQLSYEISSLFRSRRPRDYFLNFTLRKDRGSVQLETHFLPVITVSVNADKHHLLVFSALGKS